MSLYGELVMILTLPALYQLKGQSGMAVQCSGRNRFDTYVLKLERNWSINGCGD